MDSTLLLGVLLGIPASLVAAYAYDILKGMIAGGKQRIDLEGTWGEFVRNAKGRQFSVGRIYRDKRRHMYAFDGTNFENDGTPFCHWTTVVSYVDREHGQFFYTFRAEVEGELDRVYYGFGVVNLAKDERGRLVPVSGHYTSTNIDGQAMSHTMVKLSGIKYSRRLLGTDAVAFVKNATPKSQRTSRRLPIKSAA